MLRKSRVFKGFSEKGRRVWELQESGEEMGLDFTKETLYQMWTSVFVLSLTSDLPSY